jgi:post-segregation antitoxin (ccd killing protein)
MMKDMSTKPYTVTLDEDLVEQAKAYADQAGMSFSALVNQAIREHNRRRSADRWLAFLGSNAPEAADVHRSLDASRREAEQSVAAKYGHLR